MAGGESKWTWDSEVLSVYRVLWQLSVPVSNSRVVRCISDFSNFQQPCILKTAGRRIKCTQIWTSGAFSIFLIFNNFVSRKRMDVQHNSPKFGPHGYLLSVYGVLLSVKCSRSVWIFSNLVTHKWLVIQQKGPQFGPQGTYLVNMGYFWLLRVQAQSQLIRYISDFCTRSNISRKWTTGGKVPWVPVLHWAVIYHGITGYLPTNGALRDLYNPTCTYTHLQDKLVDQLVSVAQKDSTLALCAASVYGFFVKAFFGNTGSNPSKVTF